MIGESSAGTKPVGPGFLYKIGGNKKEEDGPETKRTAKEDPSML